MTYHKPASVQGSTDPRTVIKLTGIVAIFLFLVLLAAYSAVLGLALFCVLTLLHVQMGFLSCWGISAAVWVGLSILRGMR